MSDSHLLHIFKTFSDQEKDLALDEIRNQLQDDAHFILVIFLTIPFLQPIPLPGLSTPLGILISLNMIASLARQQVWIPKILAHRKISSSLFKSIEKFYQNFHRYLSKLDSPTRPFRYGQNADKVIILICGILLALPIPVPFTNSLPAWTILFLSLAEVESHTILRLFGWITSAVTSVYFFTLIKTSSWAIDYFS